MPPPAPRRYFHLPWRTARAVERDVADELRFHLDMRAAELSRMRGLAEAEARIEALRQFGDLDDAHTYMCAVDRQTERSRRRSDTMSDFRQDVEFTLRKLRTSPGFTIVAVLTLALGIGASTAIFSVVRGVLLRPLPFQSPGRLVQMWSVDEKRGTDNVPSSPPDFEDWQKQSQAFSDMAAYSTSASGPVLTGNGEPVRLATAYVTARFFPTLGVQPALGRFPTADEFVEGHDRAVVLSSGVWRRRFGSDPTLVGRTITLNEEPFTVVGIAPPSMHFPDEKIEAWAPISLVPPSSIPRMRFVRWWNVIGRLAPGVSLDRARAEMGTIAHRLAQQYPDADASYTSVAIRPLADAISGSARTPLLVLFGAVMLVVVIACVNVANLLLARASVRGRELAIRAALGAGRGRLVRQLLTESVVLSVMGGALGVALAWAGATAMVRLAGEHLPRAADVHVDGLVLAFAFGLSLVTGIAFGIIPAIRGTNLSLAPTLRSGDRSGSVSARTLQLRSALITTEVALAIVLVCGAGLMVRSFSALMHVDPGFDVEHTLVARFVLPTMHDSTRELFGQRAREIVDAVRSVPGVLAAAEAKGAPLRGHGEDYSFTLPDQPPPAPGTEPTAEALPTGPGYFATMRIPLIAGRDLTDGDTVSAMPVMVVNQTLAKRYFPGKRAVGERLNIGPRAFEIVGVVGDARTTSLDSLPHPTMFLPRAFMPRVVIAVMARTAGDPATVIPAVRNAIHAVSADLPINEILPMRDAAADAVATPRALTTLFVLFGVLALALAIVGLYGVVSFIVGQRAHEIGIRMALGARAEEVVRQMLRRGMTPVLIGVVIGVAVALPLTRLLGSLLFAVSPTDPLTFVAVIGIVVIVAAIAALIPARRAALVDPIMTLRAE